MRQRPFGRLGTASALTLGGGGIAGIWGETNREECVATVREAVDSGIDLLDLAPSYGNGEAEEVIGEAFGGNLPDGVRVTTKCRVGDTPPDQVYDHLSTSLSGSLERMRLDHVDVMFVHNAITLGSEGGERMTTADIVAEAVVPAFERLIAEGRIRHWGLTGIGEADALIRLLENGPRPHYVQCIANLLDSPGGLMRGAAGAARPREIIAAANANGTAVMGIRAVQAGALTDAIDRPLPDGHSELADYDRAAPFRAIAAEVGRSAAWLAPLLRAVHGRHRHRRPGRQEPTGAPRVRRRRVRRPPRPHPHRPHRRRRRPPRLINVPR